MARREGQRAAKVVRGADAEISKRARTTSSRTIDWQGREYDIDHVDVHTLRHIADHLQHELEDPRSASNLAMDRLGRRIELYEAGLTIAKIQRDCELAVAALKEQKARLAIELKDTRNILEAIELRLHHLQAAV